MSSKLDTEVKQRKKAEREVKELKSCLKFAAKNKFGDKRQKVDRGDDEKDAGGTPDRKKEKDNFDGTPNTLDTKSVSAPSDALHSEKRKRERDLTRPCHL